MDVHKVPALSEQWGEVVCVIDQQCQVSHCRLRGTTSVLADGRWEGGGDVMTLHIHSFVIRSFQHHLLSTHVCFHRDDMCTASRSIKVQSSTQSDVPSAGINIKQSRRLVPEEEEVVSNVQDINTSMFRTHNIRPFLTHVH